MHKKKRKVVKNDVKKSIEAWEKLPGLRALSIAETKPQEKIIMKYGGKASDGRAKSAFL